MRSFMKTGAALAVVIAMAGPVIAEEITADSVIASVGGTNITVGHLLVARANLPEQFQQLPNDVLLDGLIDQLIQQTALSQSLGDLTRRDRIGIENQTSGFRAGVALNRVAESAVSEVALLAAYEARFKSAELGQEYNAAHILVETEEEATAIKTMIDDGADFAELAREKSTGPSGPNGGALGWFSKGMMVPEFEAAVVDLEAGKVSAPVQTQFGWHIVKLNETRNKTAPALEEVRGELSEAIRNEAINAAIEAQVASAEVVRTDLELDPSVLNQLDLLDK